jgi:hypothetical protein
VLVLLGLPLAVIVVAKLSKYVILEVLAVATLNIIVTWDKVS